MGLLHRTFHSFTALVVSKSLGYLTKRIVEFEKQRKLVVLTLLRKFGPSATVICWFNDDCNLYVQVYLELMREGLKADLQYGKLENLGHLLWYCRLYLLVPIF